MSTRNVLYEPGGVETIANYATLLASSGADGDWAAVGNAVYRYDETTALWVPPAVYAGTVSLLTTLDGDVTTESEPAPAGWSDSFGTPTVDSGRVKFEADGAGSRMVSTDSFDSTGPFYLQLRGQSDNLVDGDDDGLSRSIVLHNGSNVVHLQLGRLAATGLLGLAAADNSELGEVWDPPDVTAAEIMIELLWGSNDEVLVKADGVLCLAATGADSDASANKRLSLSTFDADGAADMWIRNLKLVEY